MWRFLLLFLLLRLHLRVSIEGGAQIGIFVAQKKKQKGWVSGQTPGGGPSSPYMTQENFLRVEKQRPNQ